MQVEEVIVSSADTSIIGVYTLSDTHIADSIDNLAPGIYIVRQGGKSKKIAIK